MRKSFWALPLVCGMALAAPPATSTKAAAEPEEEDLFKGAQELFEQYAPDEIKQRFEFPSAREWDDFAQRLEQALRSNDLRKLAAYEPEARAALVALRACPEYFEYADW